MNGSIPLAGIRSYFTALDLCLILLNMPGHIKIMVSELSVDYKNELTSVFCGKSCAIKIAIAVSS
jgi:hypothetical protein